MARRTAAGRPVVDDTTWLARKLHHGGVLIERALKQQLKKERARVKRASKVTGKTEDVSTQEFLERLPSIARATLASRLRKDKAIKRDRREEVLAVLGHVETPSFGREDEKLMSKLTSSSALNRAVEDALEAIRRRYGEKQKSERAQQRRSDGGEGAKTATLSLSQAIPQATSGGALAAENYPTQPGVVNDATSDNEMKALFSKERNAKKADSKESLGAAAPKKAPHNLPSLLTGYTRGDASGSEDGSIVNDYDSDSDPAPTRKNRRGQRARRAIWEKKFGSGAKHIVARKRELEQKRAERARLRSSGGTSGNQTPLGVKGSAGRRSRVGLGAPTEAAMDAPQTAAPLARPARPLKEDHPSWKAAQMRKSKEDATAELVRRSLTETNKMNTKVVFDDD